MLSVQVPGCAGMERLGAPGGPRLRHDHRHHHSTLEWEKQQRLQAMVGAYSGDGGAGDAREVCRCGRASRPAAQHTATPTANMARTHTYSYESLIRYFTIIS
ncbi:hypothetical protein ACJJTC_014902 [Scirpophaga incertulas]